MNGSQVAARNAKDVTQIDSETVRGWRIIGRGFEHVVVANAPCPNYVLKISTHKAREFLWLTSTKNAPASELILGFRDEVAVRDRDRRRLRNYFSSDELPPERRWVGQFEISQEEARRLFHNDHWGRILPGAAYPIQCCTMFSRQRYVSLADDPARLSFSFGSFPEDLRPEDAGRAEVTRAAIAGREVCLADFLDVQEIGDHRHLRRIVEVAEADCGLRAALSRFLERAIAYANATGNIMALGGEDNVFFAGQGDSWRCILIDPFPIVPGPILHRANHLPVIPPGRGRHEQMDKELIKRALNFTRVLNVLAAWLEVDGRVRLGPHMASAAELDLSPDGSYAWPKL